MVIKSVDNSRVRRSVDEYANWLLASYSQVEEIVVFGSFAKGTYVPGSDVDIFILLSSSDKSFRDRLPDFLPGAFPVGIDLFPYTRAEVDSMKGSSLLAEIQQSQWRFRRSG